VAVNMPSTAISEFARRRDQSRSREEYEYFDRALRYEQDKMLCAPTMYYEGPIYWVDMVSSKTIVSTTVGGDRVFDKKLLLTR
jgi:hypothetical protein